MRVGQPKIGSVFADQHSLSLYNPAFLAIENPPGGYPPPPKNREGILIYGYARVSTSDQETTLQIDALKRAGVQAVFQEKTSSVGARPELRKALRLMRPGDVLIVWKLDRLARSLRDLLQILEKLRANGCAFRSLTEPVDTTSSIGEFMLQVLGAVAQLERSMIRERVIAGQVASILRGGRHGRPSSLSKEGAREAVRMYRAGERKCDIAEKLGVGRWVVDRVICQSQNPNHRKYGPKRPVLGPLLCAAVK